MSDIDPFRELGATVDEPPSTPWTFIMTSEAMRAAPLLPGSIFAVHGVRHQVEEIWSHSEDRYKVIARKID